LNRSHHGAIILSGLALHHLFFEIYSSLLFFCVPVSIVKLVIIFIVIITASLIVFLIVVVLLLIVLYGTTPVRVHWRCLSHHHVLVLQEILLIQRFLHTILLIEDLVALVEHTWALAMVDDRL
jgi:hypothetical protein